MTTTTKIWLIGVAFGLAGAGIVALAAHGAITYVNHHLDRNPR